MKNSRGNDAASRSDRALIVALAIILATASAAVGSALTYQAPGLHLAKLAAPAVTAVPTVRVIAAKSGSDSGMTELLAEHRCLAEALYYEARGEGAKGQQAVAEVVFHRMSRGNYGHSICAVVYEGAGRPGCQFSFTCNGDLTRSKQSTSWRHAELMAARILTGEIPLHNATDGATNYHAITVSPIWAGTMDKTTQIGNHIFYRGAPRSRDS